ncbi:MAG: hypothetical protein ABIG42_05955 [bacterium]
MKKNISTFPLLIGLFFVILYAAFPTKMHFIDGLLYSWNLENLETKYMLHPHHPLWLPLMHIIYNVVRSFFPDLQAIAFLSFVNAMLGGGLVYLFIRILQRFIQSSVIPILTGLFLGFSWGMMTYCADANIYILVFVLLSGSTIVLFNEEKLSLKNSLYATGLVIISSLMHQMAFLFTVPVLIAILIRRGKSHLFRNAGICTMVYAFCVIVINYIVYIFARPLVDDSITSTFLTWLTTFGGNAEWWTIGSRGLTNAASIFLYTQVNLFIHTPDSALNQLFKLYEQNYVLPAYIIPHLIIVMSLLWEIVSLIKNREDSCKTRTVRIFLLSWIIPYFIFLHFYSALSTHFKLFYFIPLMMLWAMQLNRLSDKFRGMVIPVCWVVLVIFAGWNISTGLVPNSYPERNPSLKQALIIADKVNENDLIIFSAQENYTAVVTRYYTDADAVPLRSTPPILSQTESGFLDIDRRTVEFLNDRYNRIFLSEKACGIKPRNLYFSGYFFKPPHPWELGFHPSSIKIINEIPLKNGESLYQVELTPSMRFRENAE